MSGLDRENPAAVSDILAYGEPRTLKFDMSPGVGQTELTELLAFAGDLGLSYVGSEPMSPQTEISSDACADEKPVIVIPSVYPPTDARQFFGKEHLWLVAQETGVRKSIASSLLNAVIFPIENFINNWLAENSSARPLTYEETGVAVTTRQEARLAESFIPLKRVPPTRRELIYKRQFPENKITMNTAAVQYEGFIALGEQPDLLASICTPALITAHHTVADHFAELLEA